MRIGRQRCLFHIEKDMAHRIKDAHKEKELDMAKRMIKYMFFQNETNLKKLGRNSETVRKLVEGRSERNQLNLDNVLKGKKFLRET